MVWDNLHQNALDIHKASGIPIDPWTELSIRDSLKCARMMFEHPTGRAKWTEKGLDTFKFWTGMHSDSISQLRPLARVLLGLPATAASCERVWSSAGRLNDRRSVLTEKNLEMLIFLRENINSVGAITVSDINKIISSAK